MFIEFIRMTNHIITKNLNGYDGRIKATDM